MRIAQVNIGGHLTAVDGIAAAEEAISAILAEAGHSVRRFDSPGPDVGAAASVAAGLLGAAASGAIDVVHFHSLFRPVHAGLASGLRACRVPYVLSPHSALAAAALSRDRLRKTLYLRLLERRVLEAAASIVCLTGAEARDCERLADARTAVVPNPFEGVGARSWAPPRSPRLQFVSLSRFDVYQKGLDRLARIAAHLPQGSVDVYGAPDGNEPELAGLLRRTGPDNFSLREPVFGDAKELVLSRADVYVQASRWEGFSVSLVEAFVSGLPTAVSGAIADTLPPALLDGVLVLDEDPLRAAGDLVELARDDERRLAMGALAKDWVRAELSAESVLGKLEVVYRRAVEHGAQLGR